MKHAVWITCLAGSICWAQPASKPVDTAIDFLGKGLQDSNPERRKMTASALGNAGLNPQVLTMLYDAMAKDKDPEVRQAAAASLGEMKARVAIPKLKEAMAKDPEVSFTAARSLWLMNDKSGKDLIVDVASAQQKDPTSKIAQAKLEASRRLHDPNGLERMGAESAAEALLGPFSIGLKMATELRKDAGAQGRLLALTMLAQDCDAASQTATEVALTDDKNEIVRAGAAKAVGICGDRHAMQTLTDAVASEKFTVQIAAAASIIRLSAKPASLQKK